MYSIRSCILHAIIDDDFASAAVALEPVWQFLAQLELSGSQQPADYCAEWKRSKPQDSSPPELPAPNVSHSSVVQIGPMPNTPRRFIPASVPSSPTDSPGGLSAQLTSRTGNLYTYILEFVFVHVEYYMHSYMFLCDFTLINAFFIFP